MLEPAPGQAVQDPAVLLDTVVEAIRATVEAARAAGARVAGLCVGAALHALVALDAEGRPLTPLDHLGGRPRHRSGRAPAHRAPRAARPYGHAAAPDVAALQARLVPRARAGDVRGRAALGRHQGAHPGAPDRHLRPRPLVRVRHRAVRPRAPRLGRRGARGGRRGAGAARAARARQARARAERRLRRGPARRHPCRGRRRRRPARQHRRRRSAAGSGRLLDRHERRPAGGRGAAGGGRRPAGLLLRPHPGPLGRRRGDQQRRHRAALGRRGARPRPRRAPRGGADGPRRRGAGRERGADDAALPAGRARAALERAAARRIRRPDDGPRPPPPGARGDRGRLAAARARARLRPRRRQRGARGQGHRRLRAQRPLAPGARRRARHAGGLPRRGAGLQPSGPPCSAWRRSAWWSRSSWRPT